MAGRVIGKMLAGACAAVLLAAGPALPARAADWPPAFAAGAPMDPAGPHTWRVASRNADGLILIDPDSWTRDGGLQRARILVVLAKSVAGPHGTRIVYFDMAVEADCQGSRSRVAAGTIRDGATTVLGQDLEPQDWQPADPGSNADFIRDGVCDMAAGKTVETVSDTLPALRVDFFSWAKTQGFVTD